MVRLACDLPDQVGRSLSQWDCTELARQAERDGVVEQLSPQTVQRILAAQQLKPWRSHYWLHPRGPRDAEFVRCTRAVATLLTRPLAPHEAVFSLDEKTSLQPRPRRTPTRPAQPPLGPVVLDHDQPAVRLGRGLSQGDRVDRLHRVSVDHAHGDAFRL